MTTTEIQLLLKLIDNIDDLEKVKEVLREFVFVIKNEIEI